MTFLGFWWKVWGVYQVSPTWWDLDFKSVSPHWQLLKSLPISFNSCFSPELLGVSPHLYKFEVQARTLGRFIKSLGTPHLGATLLFRISLPSFLAFQATLNSDFWFLNSTAAASFLNSIPRIPLELGVPSGGGQVNKCVLHSVWFPSFKGCVSSSFCLLFVSFQCHQIVALKYFVQNL